MKRIKNKTQVEGETNRIALDKRGYPTSSGFLDVGNCLWHCETNYYGRKISDGRLESYNSENRSNYSKILGRRAEEGWATGISTFNGNGLFSMAENPAWAEYVRKDKAIRNDEPMQGKTYVTTDPNLIRVSKLMGSVCSHNPYMFEYFHHAGTAGESYRGFVSRRSIPMVFKDNFGKEFVVYTLPENVKYQPHNSFDNVKSQRRKNLEDGC
jgi:hypothetical protein